jgi:SAM-dependent methyltransferase
MKEVVKKVYWILSAQFGVDPRRMFYSIRGVPRFIRDWLRFRKLYSGKLEVRPCLYDWYEEGGSTRNEYFWQDLHVARKINKANPRKHVDIGSRIDGFVAHVASFREVEVFDIRPITSKIEGVIFKQADLMNPMETLAGYCDSLSCLHALEHFGLGRYGDPIDPMGSSTGLKHMAGLLQPGGVFYISVPIGVERVEFNAHRVFDPLKLVQIASGNGLTLQDFDWFVEGQGLMHSQNPEQDMRTLGALRYALGIFTFRKN